jgi:hypothetical protein
MTEWFHLRPFDDIFIFLGIPCNLAHNFKEESQAHFNLLESKFLLPCPRGFCTTSTIKQLKIQFVLHAVT